MAEIGITLRNGRVQRGLTIDQVAQETRISPRFLEALEAEAFDELPAPVYVRGFLRSYANFLHLDATPLLEQLAGSASAPAGGPDGFVRGPRTTTTQSRKPTTNPFRPAAPAPRPQTQQRTAPPPEPAMPVAAARAAYEDEVDEGWAPERLPGAFQDEPVQIGRSYPPDPQRDDLEPDPGYADPEPRYRARRTSGILLERETVDGGGGSTRMLAIAAGGVVVLLFFLAVAVLLTRGGGGSNAAAPPGQSPTATSKPGTVISALGTQTGVPGTPTAAASATASPSPSASASPNATTTTTATVAVGNTTTASTPTPTATATDAPTAAPTATPRPPTPAPPTAIPTPPPPAGFQECGGTSSDPDCGVQPYRVVCYPPHGKNDWFVDVNKNYPVPQNQGWSTVDVQNPSFGAVINAGESGC